MCFPLNPSSLQASHFPPLGMCCSLVYPFSPFLEHRLPNDLSVPHHCIVLTSLFDSTPIVCDRFKLSALTKSVSWTCTSLTLQTSRSHACAGSSNTIKLCWYLLTVTWMVKNNCWFLTINHNHGFILYNTVKYWKKKADHRYLFDQALIN